MANINDFGTRTKWSTPKQTAQVSKMPSFTGPRTPIAPTNIGQMSAPRQTSAPTMPRFSGKKVDLPAILSGGGRLNINNQRQVSAANNSGYRVELPIILSGGGGLNLNNPRQVSAVINKGYRNVFSRQPENTHAKQLYNVTSQDIYQPEAEEKLYGVPFVTEDGNPGRMAYDSDNNRFLYPGKDYFTRADYNPMINQEDIVHEGNHFFDRGDKYSSNPEFLAAAKKTDAEFYPGMGLIPTVGNWGGKREMYADVGRNPYWFRKLSKWYPQFAPKAYNMPAFAGTLDLRNQDRTWQFKPPEGRGPYTDIANRDPNKLITMPDPTPIVQASR